MANVSRDQNLEISGRRLMAAVKVINHTPLVSRQPKDIPLPPSPAQSVSPPPVEKNKKKKRSDKEKEKEKVNEGLQHAVMDGPSSVTVQPENAPSGQWNWISLTDSTTSSHPPIFTNDGSHFFSVVGSSIKIHSTRSGKVVSTLPQSQDQGHTGIITSATLSAQNPFQLITASLDGTIKIWDFLEGVLLRTIDIDQSIHHICTHEKVRDHVFVAAVKAKKKDSQNESNQIQSSGMQEESCTVLRVSLKTQGPNGTPKAHKASQIIPIGKTRATAGLAVSASGERLIAVAGHKAYVAQVASLKAGFTKFVSPEILTCLAVHPTEDYFATGDVKGVVRLWYCLDPNLVKMVGVEKKSQTSTLHWHAHAVSSVAFTPNGAYLLTGGEEAVLVVWQLHSGKKEFVPRVGSPIKNIVVSQARASEEEYLLGLADASYAFVSSTTLRLSRTFARIKLDPAVSDSLPSSSTAPLAVHSLSDTLVLPSSHPSSLQTYSPSTSTLVAELEVSSSNRVSRRDERTLESSRVEYAVVSSNGEWMATVDHREGDESFRGEIYLKLWYWDKRNAFWILNTRVDRPHGHHRVTSITFSPDSHNVELVTTGEDGNVKMWRIRSMKDKHGNTEVSWTPRTSFGFKSYIPRHASWSQDGSLLAVANTLSVVLHDPKTTIILQSFVCRECCTPSRVHFIGPSGRFLAVTGGVDLVVWDIISQSVVWHLKNTWRYDALVPHPYQDSFIAVHSPPSNPPQSTITVFQARSRVPQVERTLSFGVLSLVWYPQPSMQTESFSLVCLTHSYGVVLMGDAIKTPEERVSTKTLQTGPEAPRRTLFEELFGVSALTGSSEQHQRETASSSAVLPWRCNETASFFDAPSHLIPPIETLFDPLIGGLLRTRIVDDGQEHNTHLDVTDDMMVDAVEDEPSSVKLTEVSADSVFDVFVPLFKEMTESPDYPCRSAGHIPSPHTPARSTPKPPKPTTRPSTREKPVQSDISTSATPARTGRKRSRPSLG
ncbi:WD40-repeat-containing domain protein [Phlebopus sp. FC_14]|nr:WD40-repeat-containing domain protein [Phlebopus sp. FC_14]